MSTWPRDHRGRYIALKDMTPTQRATVQAELAQASMHGFVSDTPETEADDDPDLVHLTDTDRRMIRDLLAAAERFDEHEFWATEPSDWIDGMIVRTGIWPTIKSSPLLALAIGCILLGTILMLLASCGGERVPTVRATEPCSMSVSDAEAEDDICTTWLDDDGNVVFGPLWAKPGPGE